MPQPRSHRPHGGGPQQASGMMYCRSNPSSKAGTYACKRGRHARRPWAAHRQAPLAAVASCWPAACCVSRQDPHPPHRMPPPPHTHTHTGSAAQRCSDVASHRRTHTHCKRPCSRWCWPMAMRTAGISGQHATPLACKASVPVSARLRRAWPTPAGRRRICRMSSYDDAATGGARQPGQAHAMMAAACRACKSRLALILPFLIFFTEFHSRFPAPSAPYVRDVPLSLSSMGAMEGAACLTTHRCFPPCKQPDLSNVHHSSTPSMRRCMIARLERLGGMLR